VLSISEFDEDCFRIDRDDFLEAKRLFTSTVQPWFHHIVHRLLECWNALYIWLVTRWYFYRGYDTDERFRHDFTADISAAGVRLVASSTDDKMD